MAVTVDDVAFAIRLDSPDPQISAIVARHIATAAVLIDRRCSTTLPEAIRDEAIIRVAGWLYNSPFASRGDVWRASGAADLLRSWTTRGTAQVEAQDGDTSTTTTATGVFSLAEAVFCVNGHANLANFVSATGGAPYIGDSAVDDTSYLALRLHDADTLWVNGIFVLTASIPAGETLCVIPAGVNRPSAIKHVYFSTEYLTGHTPWVALNFSVDGSIAAAVDLPAQVSVFAEGIHLVKPGHAS